jgi:hypothetical protein
MKPNRDADALAAALTNAAAAPPPLPQRAPPVAANTSVAPEAPPPAPPRGKKAKAAPDTVGITLRPDRALLTRYTNEAADRTRAEGKVISAQQIMLEVLERGLRGKS